MCTKDEDCPSDQKCDLTAGVCRLKCTTDADCPTGQRCNKQINMCVPIIPCENDKDCPAGQKCVEKMCKEIIVKCNADGSCPLGYEKVPNPPAGECLCRLIEPECPPGQVKCANGCFEPGDPKCIPLPCNNNKTCEANESCNCADCYNQQDKCEDGLVCRELTKDCRYKNCTMESAAESGAQCTDNKDNDCDGNIDGADDTNCFDPFKCKPDQVKCANGCFDSYEDSGCIRLSCNKNNICDAAESCNCSDCYDQQDSCRLGEVCRELTGDCRLKNCKLESSAESSTQCYDGKDNDCDGTIDGADEDCKGAPIPCNADGTCPAGYKKDPLSPPNKCQCLKMCTKDEDCPSDQKCDLSAGVCRLKCTSDADCPTGQRCNKQINMCVPIIPC